MQSTIYIPDEVEGPSHGLKVPRGFGRAPSRLEDDTTFAEIAIGEKQALLGPQTAAEQGKTIAHNLVFFTKDRKWLYGVWGLEVLWHAFMVMAIAVELWGSCPFQSGFAPVCRYCYSEGFLLWLGVTVLLWGLNLFTYVLLVSRGFSFRLRTLGNSIHYNKTRGVPPQAMYFYLCISFMLATWLFVGLFIIIGSNRCLAGGRFLSTQDRSSLMFFTTLVTLLVAPVLLLLGRLIDFRQEDEIIDGW